MNKIICKLCYREFGEEDIVKNISGELTGYCRTCSSILGKGTGYSDIMSDKEIDKWLEDIDERKKLVK